MKMFRIRSFKFSKLSIYPKLFKNKKGNTQEVDLSKSYPLFPDRPVSKEIPDIFERKEIAKEIAKAITNSSGQMNFLISGEWGIGKTSVLNLIEENLLNYKCIRFSPWKYSSGKEGASAISKAYITVLAKYLNRGHTTSSLYLDKHIESERNLPSQIVTLVFIVFNYLIYLVTVLIVVFALFQVLGYFFPYLKINAETIVKQFNEDKNSQLTIIGLLIALIAFPPLGQYFISRIKESGEIAKLNSPELFEKEFNNLLEHSVRNKWLQLTLNFLEKTFQDTPLSFLGVPFTNLLTEKLFLKNHRYKKIVVLIDDLERCEKEEVKEFLAGMKTFLENNQVYYVIAADIDKLKEKVENSGLPEKDNFLRKIIQIDWNVPFLKRDDIQAYIVNLFKQVEISYSDHFIEETTNIFQIQPNPRKIKYYLRRLFFLLNISEYINPKYKEFNFNEDQQALLLKFIVLAELNNPVYKYLVNHPNEIPVLEGGETLSDSNLKEVTKNQDQELLNKTQAILASEPISSSIVDITLFDVLELVGSFEEKTPDVEEFFKLAESDTVNAVKFLENPAYKWKRLKILNQLIGLISQTVEVIKESTEDPLPKIEGFRKSIVTTIEAIEMSESNKSEEAKELIKSLLKTLVLLGGNFKKALDELLTKVYKIALNFNVDEFWDNLFQLPNFQTADEFLEVINKLEIIDLKQSLSSSIILNKLVVYLDSEKFDDLMNQIENKELILVKNNDNLERKLVDYYLNTTDSAKKDKLFTSFISTTELSPNSQNDIIKDVFTRSDISKLLTFIKSDLYIKLIAMSYLDDLASFLETHVSFADGNYKAMILELFKPKNFEILKLWQGNVGKFLNNLAGQLINITNVTERKEYSDLFLQTELSEIIKKGSGGTAYSSILTNLAPNMDRGGKIRIGKYKSKLKV